MGLLTSDTDRRLVYGDADTASPSVFGKRYAGVPGQQLHILEGGISRDIPPLCCLHATAYSGRSFLPFMQAMAPHRRVLAIDTPGYGGSDRLTRRPDIGQYAQAIERGLDAAGEGTIDLLGYHTGALMAAELARQYPDRVRRLVLIGVPFLTGAEQAAWREKLAARTRLTESIDQFQERWKYFITDRHAGVNLERGFENFVDELRAYPEGWWAHDAAFTFDVEHCFAAIRQRALVLNPANHLAEPSRRAATALVNSEVHELPHLSNGIFDVAPDEIAERIDAFLRST